MASKDILDRIMAAELKAREMIEQARVSAEEILARERLAAEAGAKHTLEEASARLNDSREKAMDSADAGVRSILESYRQELDATPLDAASFVSICRAALYGGSGASGEREPSGGPATSAHEGLHGRR